MMKITAIQGIAAVQVIKVQIQSRSGQYPENLATVMVGKAAIMHWRMPLLQIHTLSPFSTLV